MMPPWTPSCPSTRGIQVVQVHKACYVVGMGSVNLRIGIELESDRVGELQVSTVLNCTVIMGIALAVLFSKHLY